VYTVKSSGKANHDCIFLCSFPCVNITEIIHTYFWVIAHTYIQQFCKYLREEDGVKRNLYLNTLLFADDQVIIQDSEDKIQKSVYTVY
jgi:hypothetical protein